VIFDHPYNADYALVADNAFAAVNQRRISVLFSRLSHF